MLGIVDFGMWIFWFILIYPWTSKLIDYIHFKYNRFKTHRYIKKIERSITEHPEEWHCIESSSNDPNWESIKKVINDNGKTVEVLCKSSKKHRSFDNSDKSVYLIKARDLCNIRHILSLYKKFINNRVNIDDKEVIFEEGDINLTNFQSFMEREL